MNLIHSYYCNNRGVGLLYMFTQVVRWHNIRGRVSLGWLDRKEEWEMTSRRRSERRQESYGFLWWSSVNFTCELWEGEGGRGGGINRGRATLVVSEIIVPCSYTEIRTALAFAESEADQLCILGVYFKIIYFGWDATLFLVP